jgi:hypothetical protein
MSITAVPPTPFALGVDPTVTYDPVGQCIYCDSDTERLGDEHIIPYSLNGTHILPRASCHACEKVTSYLDGFVSRSVFYQLRTAARMRTRTELPDEFPVILHFEDGHKEEVVVPAEIHPATLTLPKFQMPDLLSGRPPDGNFRFTYTTWMRESAAFDEFVKERGAKVGEVKTTIKCQQFSRVLAKIAHAYAVARLGADGFNPLLLDLIHRRDVEKGPELVGGEPDVPQPATGKLHELDLMPHAKFVVVRIRLFASSIADGRAMPVYIVVAGEKLSFARAVFR